jgi:hypothetical protein
MALYANKFNPGAFEVAGPHFHVKYVFHEKAAKPQLPAKPSRTHPLEYLLKRKPVTPRNREPAIMLFVVLSRWLKKSKSTCFRVFELCRNYFVLATARELQLTFSFTQPIFRASGSSNMHSHNFEGLLHLPYYIIVLQSSTS